MRDIVKLTILLAVICLLNGLALGLVYEFTRGSIERAAAKTLTESLTVVVPQADRFSERKERPLPDGGKTAYYDAYAKNGEVIGYAVLGERQGYQSIIKVLVGIDHKGIIQGIKVLQQAETPGLGARIDEVQTKETIWTRLADLFKKHGPVVEDRQPWFQEQYRGLSANELVLLKATQKGKGIHAITGATITSRALTQAVRDSIEAFLAGIIHEPRMNTPARPKGAS
jgi:electron transport complex protein RnfG